MKYESKWISVKILKNEHLSLTKDFARTPGCWHTGVVDRHGRGAMGLATENPLDDPKHMGENQPPMLEY